jgi:glucosaminylphosphatidylinositol acyltransferase
MVCFAAAIIALHSKLPRNANA